MTTAHLDTRTATVLQTLVSAYPDWVEERDLASRVGVSPSSLAYMLEEMIKQGFQFQYEQSAGYRWVPAPARIIPCLVRLRLTDHLFARRLLHVPCCESTNEVLWLEIERGADAGTVVTTDTQTRGRGRAGRRWYSAPGKDLLVSIAVPSVGADPPTLLGTWASLAVADLLKREKELPVGLKWPNDIVAGERKVGGVLVEIRSGQQLAVVGIGLNVLSTAADRPQEVSNMAVSLLELEDRAWDRSFLLADLLNSLGRWWQVRQSEGWSAIVGNWRRLCCTLGRHVSIRHRSTLLSGVATDIDDTGRLVLLAADGGQHYISIGELTDLVVGGSVSHNGRNRHESKG